MPQFARPRHDDIALRALQALPGTIAVAFDHDLRVLLATGPKRAFQGRDPAKLRGEPLAAALGEAAFQRLVPRLRAGLRGSTRTFSYRTQDDDDLEVTVVPLTGRDGKVTGAVAVGRIDLGEALMRRLADQDPLTGLLTRERLHEELGHIVALADRYGEPAVVGVLDLDNFKYVNDAHGHGIGDHVLAQAAAVLRRRLRETDAIGRLGSDEFAFVLPRTGLDAATDVAADLLRALREDPVVHGGAPVRLTASVGLASVEPADGAPASASDLLAAADIAMYAAKEAGRDRVEAADPGHRSLARARASLTWAGRIQHALDHDGLILHAQPILNLAEDRVDRHELLLRMIGDDGAPVLPGEFLSTAERFGQMPAIDRWVVGRALELLRATPGGDPVLEVNLSAASVTDADTVAFIARSVAESGVDPHRLIFEITETVAIADMVRAGVLARRLRELGCRFALDDFGAGFGSLAYLKHLPFDVVKIDGEFIKDLPRSREDQLTVGAIAQMVRGLGKTTIAEFVQDEETVELLRELGVDLAQGVHVGPARPIVW